MTERGDDDKPLKLNHLEYNNSSRQNDSCNELDFLKNEPKMGKLPVKKITLPRKFDR